MSQKITVTDRTISHYAGSPIAEKFKMAFSTTGTNGKTMTITGDVLPSADATYNLGSADKKWGSVFMGENTQYMGNNGLLTVVKGNLTILNRKDGNLFPPPLWHHKQALFKYGIITSVQQDPVTRKNRNYMGTITFDETVSSYNSGTKNIVIANNSNNTETEDDDFYKDWYISTTGTVGGSSTSIYAKITGYTASSKTLALATWYSDSTLDTEVTVTAISGTTNFNLQSPAAYSSQLQSKLDEFNRNCTITTVTSQSKFVITSSDSSSLHSSDNFYKNIYILKVTISNVDYYAKVTKWTVSTSTIEIAGTNPWYDDFSLHASSGSQPTITTSHTFQLIPKKIRLVDLNIENMLNILKTDVPNAKDYKKYNRFGDNLIASDTSFVTQDSTPWNDMNVYDTQGRITATYDEDKGIFKSGTTIDIYDTNYDHSSGYNATSLGESTFRSVSISQSSITGGDYNTIHVILPSNDANSLSTSIDYTDYELQLKDTDGHIEYLMVASSTSVTVDSVEHIQLTVSYPFYSKPTTSHEYVLQKFVNAYEEDAGSGFHDTISNNDQSTNVTSLNYQIVLNTTAISEDDYYNGYKITVEVYDSETYQITSIHGIITDYNGSTYVATISNSTYGSGNQWTTDGAQASVLPNSSGYDYYILEKSGGDANYQTNYYEQGTIVYDPLKTSFEANYNNLSAAVSAGMDAEMYKYMKQIENDADALNFDEFDASAAVAYNWSDYFFENKNWYGTTNAMYTDEKCVMGTTTPPSSDLYCQLSVYGSLKSRAILSIPSDAKTSNIQRITTDYKNKGYIFSNGLFISNSNLSTTTLRSTDINLTDGQLIVKGSSTFDGSMTMNGSVSMNGTTNFGNTVNYGGGYGDSGVTIYTNGNINMDGNLVATEIEAVSDRRLKENITALTQEHIDKLLQLTPVSFTWKSDTEKNTDEITEESNTSVFGFIAQDVEPIFPNMVNRPTDSSKEYYSLKYLECIPLLVKTIQSQQTLLNELQETVSTYLQQENSSS